LGPSGHSVGPTQGRLGPTGGDSRGRLAHAGPTTRSAEWDPHLWRVALAGSDPPLPLAHSAAHSAPRHYRARRRVCGPSYPPPESRPVLLSACKGLVVQPVQPHVECQALQAHAAGGAAQSLRPNMGNVASNTVNQMAFCPPPPTYRKQDVNMWLETDRGSRIPAFHIRRGYPLTVLVSHANAEDLGIVLGFWSWLSDRLQVSRWRARVTRAVARAGRRR
jgi:hypothetical protein